MLFFTAQRLEIQNQGVGRAGSSEAPPPGHADSYLLPVSPHGFSSACFCVLISSLEDTSHIGLEPTLMTLHYLNYSLEALSPNIVTF